MPTSPAAVFYRPALGCSRRRSRPRTTTVLANEGGTKRYISGLVCIFDYLHTIPAVGIDSAEPGIYRF